MIYSANNHITIEIYMDGYVDSELIENMQKQLDEKESEKAMSTKELNAKKIAEARRRMAEKYGDVYTEDEE